MWIGEGRIPVAILRGARANPYGEASIPGCAHAMQWMLVVSEAHPPPQGPTSNVASPSLPAFSPGCLRGRRRG